MNMNANDCKKIQELKAEAARLTAKRDALVEIAQLTDERDALVLEVKRHKGEADLLQTVFDGCKSKHASATSERDAAVLRAEAAEKKLQEARDEFDGAIKQELDGHCREITRSSARQQCALKATKLLTEAVKAMSSPSRSFDAVLSEIRSFLALVKNNAPVPTDLPAKCLSCGWTGPEWALLDAGHAIACPQCRNDDWEKLEKPLLMLADVDALRGGAS